MGSQRSQTSVIIYLRFLAKCQSVVSCKRTQLRKAFLSRRTFICRVVTWRESGDGDDVDDAIDANHYTCSHILCSIFGLFDALPLCLFTWCTYVGLSLFSTNEIFHIIRDCVLWWWCQSARLSVCVIFYSFSDGIR